MRGLGIGGWRLGTRKARYHAHVRMIEVVLYFPPAPTPSLSPHPGGAVLNEPPDCPPPPLSNVPVLARRQLRGEPELRAAVARWLQAQRIPLAGRIVCVAGVPDVVSAEQDLIVEVKVSLSRRVLHLALGQVLSYRAAINPEARALIVGYATPDTLAMRPIIESLGVEVLCWEDIGAGDWGLGAGEEEAQIAAAPFRADPAMPAPALDQLLAPNPQPLHWNVARLAQAQGITNPSALARRLGVSRQGLYVIWRGEAAQVSLDMLARLACALEADPGDWFGWGLEAGDWGLDSGPQPPVPSPQPLLWRVRERAEALGVRMTALGFVTGLHGRSLSPIWHGEARAVGLETLAKLAAALSRPEQPFSVGDLFTRHGAPKGT